MKSISHLEWLFRCYSSIIRGKRAILPVLVTLLWLGSTAQNSANIIVQPASTTTTIGQTFTIAVRIDFTTPPGSSSLDAAEVHLAFDNTKDTVVSITKSAIGVLPIEAIPLDPIHTINLNGRVNYASAATSGFPNADFDYLTITFRAIGATASTPLTLLTAFPNKSDLQRLGSSILGSVSNGTVTIQNCTAPTATLSAGAASTTCNAQAVGLRLSSATGTSPFTVIVNGTTYSNVTVGNVFGNIPFPTYSFFPSNPTPAVPNNNDGNSIEYGVKFFASQSGFIKSIRFYNGSSTSGTYTGKLYNFGTSTLLASANFSGVTANGWQQVNFSSPVYISANTTYIAAVYSSAGNYSVTDNYFTSAVTNGPITAYVNNGAAGTNGVYHFPGAGMPTTPYAASNYWVDVVYAQGSNSFNLTSITDAGGCNVTGALQTLVVNSVDCSTLPVTLLNLSALPSGNKIVLKWSTSSEINNRGFEILRSTDGTNWINIGFVNGAGNSYAQKNYSYTDNNLETRRYYYKLKQVDIDERYKFSAIVSATIGGRAEYTLGQNFPNPFSGETTIQFTLPQSQQVNLSLFDVNGRMVKVLVNGNKDAGTHVVNFSTGALTKGVYYYRIQAGNFTDVKKLTIQ